MANKKKDLAPTRVVEDNDSETLELYVDGKLIEGQFQTKKPSLPDKDTIEYSVDGKTWTRVPFIHIGKAKFDDNYDPEFDPKEQGKNMMISPAEIRTRKGNM